METCLRCSAPRCISQLSLFYRLDQTQRDSIIKNVKRRGFKKGEVFLHEGDVISQFVVVSQGQFRAINYKENGRVRVIQYLKMGDFFGQESLFQEKTITYTIEAMSDAMLCMIDARTIQDIIHNEPDFALVLLNELSNRVNQLETELAQVHIERLEIRLLDLLHQLSQDYGIKVEKGMRLKCPLSQEEMAKRLGVSRESVNRKLKQLEKENQISILSRKEIIVYKV